MKKLRNILRGFAGNNRGAGIVVVLVSMVCVALMGASILFMSYTAIRLKTTERQASKDFYSAETAVDEIRAGVQSVVSEAIATAYKYALEHYSSGVDVTDDFQDEFVKVLKKQNILFYPENGKTKYKVLTLEDYVSNDNVDVVGTGEVQVDEDKNTFLLKDIQVTYEAENGYETTISTDIFINAPKFSYVSSHTRLSGLPHHALIARKALVHDDGTQSQIQIFGSAYAGKITLGTAGSKMTISDGTLVCAGDVFVSGTTADGRLVTKPTSNGAPFKLWAGRIVVDGDSSVDLDGETRVLDDLDLAGSGAEAVLSGSYYGFGDGTSDDGSTTGNADRSSAILVNGANSTLDISGLNRLMLAGRAYISNILYPSTSSLEGFSPQNLETLESVSVRSNQQMYLIDPKYLSGTSQNPLISGEATPTVSLTTEGSTLADTYGFELKALHLPVAGANSQKAHYYLMDFKDNVSTSAYFEDYFRANSAQMNSYLGAGSNLNSLTTNAPGYAIGGSNGNYYVTQADDADFGWDSLRATFELLKTTLIDPNPGLEVYDPNDSNYPYDPYKYIVNTDLVDGVNGVRNFMLNVDEDADLEVVAVVTDEDFTISAGDGYSDLLIVISSKDVTVSRDFNGLVISGGTIDIQGGVTQGGVTLKADPTPVAAAFSAKNGTETFRDYLRHGADAIVGEDVQLSTDGWKLDSIVTYKNWIKN